MTYATLKGVINGLLIGDSLLPVDNIVTLGLMQYALTTVATSAESLHLMTLSTTADVLRLSQGDYLIRRPVAPVLDSDQVDIDDDLVFAVARLMASYVSKKNGPKHEAIAARIILDYNAKTYEILDQMQLEAAKLGVEDLCYTAPTTEWSFTL